MFMTTYGAQPEIKEKATIQRFMNKIALVFVHYDFNWINVYKLMNTESRNLLINGEIQYFSKQRATVNHCFIIDHGTTDIPPEVLRKRLKYNFSAW